MELKNEIELLTKRNEENKKKYEEEKEKVFKMEADISDIQRMK